MSTLNGKSYSDIRNVNLRGGQLGTGLLKWAQYPCIGSANWASNTFSSTEVGLYVNAAGNMVYSYLGTGTVLGAAGSSGATPSWNTIFGGTQTMSVQGTAFTIQDTTGTTNNVLSIAASSTSGALIELTQSGSGNDITGTAGWSVSKAGAATFLSVASATLNGAGAGLTLGDSGANVITIGTGSNTVTLAKATTFSSTILGVSQSLVSASNTVVPMLVTDNTITTFGAGVVNGGVLVARSTSVTTGTIIRAQGADGALTTGKYFEAWDTTDSDSVFSVGVSGATVIAGSAFATAALTLTAGDLIVTSGKLNVTTADNTTTSISFIDNTKAAHTLLAVAGSGTFTGTTTTSFATITPSGLTTGTALYIVAAAATSSVAVVDIATAALTSGSALRITGGTATFTTGGKLIELSSTASVAGNLLTATTTGAYTGTGMILVTAGAATTGVLVSIVSTTGLTTGSLLRATSSTAGAIATNGAISFSATGVYTSTSNAGFVNITANATTAGTVLAVNATGLVDGIGIFSPSAEAGLTSGKYISMGGKFTVAKFGATVIAGSAAGTAALTLTAGDILVSAGSIKSASASASGGIGYATGAGGTATQGTDRSTGVTMSPNPCLSGTITTMTTSLAAEASAEFVVTNSAVAIGDVILLSQRSGSSSVAGVAGNTIVNVVTVTNGTFTISVSNQSTTTAETGAIIINFVIIKAVSA